MPYRGLRRLVILHGMPLEICVPKKALGCSLLTSSAPPSSQDVAKLEAEDYLHRSEMPDQESGDPTLQKQSRPPSLCCNQSHIFLCKWPKT